MPLTTLLGLAGGPGEVGGFGPVDAALARQLGRAGPPPGRAGPPGEAGPGRFLPRDLTVTITALASETCDHRNEEPGYEPSRRLQHLVRARTATCSAPGCARPAAHCDLDHTVPYDQDGRTCECNLPPLCRHHHRCKQAEGWRLQQPQPGIMRWTPPPDATTSPPQRRIQAEGQSLAG